MRIFKKELGVEKQIDDFLDQVSRSGLIFSQGAEAYLQGESTDFERKLTEIIEVEHAGDDLRRSIQQYLYTKTLIPESRGDVLQLIEDMDSLLDRFKGALWRMEIENLDIEEDFHKDFRMLIKTVVETVEAIVRAARAFFKNISSVADHLDKVYYWESESDKISTRLQMAIFRKEELRLSHRMLQRELARHLDKIADRAEDVADRLNIYVIKRSL
jgi:predicted phosphate transport protein (TIGR00153 family)